MGIPLNSRDAGKHLIHGGFERPQIYRGRERNERNSSVLPNRPVYRGLSSVQIKLRGNPIEKQTPLPMREYTDAPD